MSQPLQLTDVWRRSLEATVQFYSAMGELAVECVETLLATTTQSNSGATADGRFPPAPAAKKQAATAPDSAPVSMMVLEAEAGRKALGVFLVENGFSRAVSAAATASAFVDEEGNELNLAVEFEPSSITLQPGEQILVKVLASISKDMPAGVRYRGEIGVPGLMGTRIPVVMGRTAEAKVPGAANALTASAPAAARRKNSGLNSSPQGKSKKRKAKG